MTRHAGAIERISSAGVVPVLTIEDVALAVPLAEALILGGLDVLEITLRTRAGLGAIRAITDAGLNCLVGAGTVVSAQNAANAEAAGAQFLVTPGTPDHLRSALNMFSGLVIPGAATPSEVMALFHEGYSLQKLFPSEPVGGVSFLKSMAGPFPEVSFMPTGGIREDTAAEYLALDNVIAVGGSWIAPDHLVQAQDWAAITALAQAARARVG